MRNKFFFAVLFSMISIASFSQKRALADVKAVLETFKAALISGDKASLIAHTSPDLTYGHSSGLIENRDEFVEKLSSGKSDFISIDITNESIELFKNTAIVRHELTAQTNDNGKPGTIKLKVLLVWVKTDSVWALVARQAVKPPVAG